ncbi:MurR/RpiR family transcriptional regulator [Kluyvera georgiana]|uniref:MurR/RpiR family transcriptional regulator n=1 Tax=Kluyvera georgiana TaxID=73098 RepID=UPI003D989E2E
MESIISKIQALAEAKNGGDRRISTYLIERNFDISDLSATRMGQELGISDSSVIRYAKALGCSGFPELKLWLAAASHPQKLRAREEIYEGIEASDSTHQMVEKARVLFASKIDQSLDLLDPQTIDTCARLLIDSRKIVLVGIGTSALIALDINHKLIRCGLNVQFNYDYHTQIVQASLLQPGDVLLAVSARGETAEVVEALELARERGAYTIAITRYGKNKVSQIAEHVIPYSYTEAHEKLGMVTPQILQMIAFDILFFRINSLVSPDSMSTALRTINKRQQKGSTP